MNEPNEAECQQDARAREGEMLLYDHAKHLLSLAVLGIGGVMSLSQSGTGAKIGGPTIALLIGFFTASGLCSLAVSAAILRARRDGQPLRASAWIFNQGAMGLLGAALGAFVTAWIEIIL